MTEDEARRICHETAVMLAWAAEQMLPPPTPGYYRVNFVRRGWRVPARIERLADGSWQATVDGAILPAHHDPLRAPGVTRVQAYGRPSTEAEYRYLNRLRELAPPSHPCRRPDRPINLDEMPPVHVPVRR
jgi:hypothetical protein